LLLPLNVIEIESVYEISVVYYLIFNQCIYG
jgi:hypothetical protein